MLEFERIGTEQRNQNTAHIDSLSTLNMLRLMNDEDKKVAFAVAQVLPQIAEAVDVIFQKLSTGGRLVYCGCGTSGRLGVLDAAECPPTFGTDPSLVVALIAGGSQAFVHAVEGAEDNAAMGRSDLMAIHLSGDDVLVGIAASGRTPYVLGAMAYAHTLDTPVICVTCSSGSEMSRMADISIEPIPGPEVITGSTRLKSGTAQKMVLNMLSTATMIKLGKVYGNLMVDVKATNEKLMERTVSIVRTATGANDTDARKALRACKNSAKSAIMMLMGGLDATQAQLLLEQCDGRITQALEQLHS